MLLTLCVSCFVHLSSMCTRYGTEAASASGMWHLRPQNTVPIHRSQVSTKTVSLTQTIFFFSFKFFVNISATKFTIKQKSNERNSKLNGNLTRTDVTKIRVPVGRGVAWRGKKGASEVARYYTVITPVEFTGSAAIATCKYWKEQATFVSDYASWVERYVLKFSRTRRWLGDVGITYFG